MGQAVADLPDPLESAGHSAAASTNPAEAQSADDLLSQLAGDEIDRLLAESDGDTPPSIVAGPQNNEAESASAPEELEAEHAPETVAIDAAHVPDEIVAQPNLETPVASAALEQTQAPVVSVEDEAGGLDLDAVLETAVAEHDAAAAEKSALHAAEKSAPVVKSTGHEKKFDSKNSATASPASPAEQQIELGDSGKRLPLIFRPLEWLSSPLDPWPDQLREMIGKIGLMTLINALAVLAYVLLVRRHHH